MYINLAYLAEIELTLEDVIILQLCKQQRIEDCTTALEVYEDRLSPLGAKGLLTSVKGNKKDSYLRKIRISKAGESILTNVETPELLEEDLKIFEWMKQVYLGLDKKLGNQKKTKTFIALFRVQSGINRNKLAKLVSEFVSDDSNMGYNNVLEYAFCKPQNAYSTRFVLEESRLYKYYLQHKAYFDAKFETL